MSQVSTFAGTGESNDWTSLSKLVVRWAKRKIAHHLKSLHESVKKNNSVLTSVVVQLLPDLQNASGGHEWGDRKETVTISLLTGKVLVNGSQPSQLPLDIEAHPDFRGLFGPSLRLPLVRKESAQNFSGRMKDVLGRNLYLTFSLKHHTSADQTRPPELLLRRRCGESKEGDDYVFISDASRSLKGTLPSDLLNQYSHWMKVTEADDSEIHLIKIELREKSVTWDSSKKPDWEVFFNKEEK
eukprot:g35200.t1